MASPAVWVVAVSRGWWYFSCLFFWLMTIIPMHNGGRGLTYQLLWSHHPSEQWVWANLFLNCRIYYSRIIKTSEYDIAQVSIATGRWYLHKARCSDHPNPTVFLQWLSIIIDTHMVASENSGNWQITKLFAAVRMTFYVHFNKSELSTL